MIINAKEARRKSLLHSKLRAYLEMIQDSIDRAIENGRYDTTVYFSHDLDSSVVATLTKEFTSLGYKVEYMASMPCPEACPPSQWHSSAYLNIDWEDDLDEN